MGYYEALRRSLSRIFGREVQEDDPALFQLYTKSTMPAAGATPFKHFGVSPNTTPPGVCFDSNGAVRYMLNTSGAITEASAAAINGNTGYTACNTVLSAHATISGPNGINSGTTPTYNAQLRIGRAVATADGAGAFANVPLVAALAGYYGVVKITSIKPNATVAAGAASLTFESPAGTAALPSLEVQPGITANMRDINMQGLVITHATLVDNQAIVVDGAGWGALTVVEIMFDYWYET